MSNLGIKIKELRKINNLTQKELGDKLNVGKSTISQYENNINTPDIDTIKKISKIFNVQIDYLLNDTNNKIILNKDQYKNALSIDDLLDILKKNFEVLSSKEEKDASRTMLSIFNALIDTGALNEDNFNEDTMNIIKSTLKMYIKSRAKTTIK